MKKKVSLSALLAFVVISVIIFTPHTLAFHAWTPYHWPRTTNPFTLKFVNNVTTDWEKYLNRSLVDWNRSSVLDTVLISGTPNPNCKASFGKVAVCNGEYGETGWLGLVYLWVRDGHIMHGVVRLNDTYFKLPQFNTSAVKYNVICEEIGHALGLDHQDTDPWNIPLGTCMDYSEDSTKNQRPNAHDYEMLETIYTQHLDENTAATGPTVIIISPGGEYWKPPTGKEQQDW